MTEEYGGSRCLADGTRQILTPQEAKELWESSERWLRERAQRIPDEKTALSLMFDAFDRLRELGWREASYCPKDGTSFEAIEAGSTGIFRCHYNGEWPDGSWWLEDGGDLWPSRPILFRLYPEDESKRQARMAEAAAKFRAEEEKGGAS